MFGATFAKSDKYKGFRVHKHLYGRKTEEGSSAKKTMDTSYKLQFENTVIPLALG